MINRFFDRIVFKILNRLRDKAIEDTGHSIKVLSTINGDILERFSKFEAVEYTKFVNEKVPAYNRFLKKNKVKVEEINTIDDFQKQIPFTTRDGYVKNYSQEDLCIGGKLPRAGNIDESAGSSGKAFSWVRSHEENKNLELSLKFQNDYLNFKNDRNVIMINAFTSGPWAAGIKVVNVVEHFSLVKNTELNQENILNTLKLYGNNYNYVIFAYPPFMKQLIEFLSKRMKLKSYNIIFITGGEGMAYGLRGYVLKHLSSKSRIYSSYGASDIDIGIASETPICIYLRDLIHDNPELQTELFGHTGKIPMIFQYDPTRYFIENSRNKVDGRMVNEFIITSLYPNKASPKIRYLLHDEGIKKTYNETIEIIEKYDPNFFNKYKASEKSTPIIHLPFLFVEGRSDGTISLDGANVYPHQIELAISSDHNLYQHMNHFMIKKDYDKKKNVMFMIYIELSKETSVDKKLIKRFETVILNKLLKINTDYRQSYYESPELVKPHIIISKHGEGVFKDLPRKIKKRYILKD